MSIERLEAAAAELPDAERRELIGYLINFGREKSAEYWEKMHAKIGDRDPAHWVTEEDLDRAISVKEDPAPAPATPSPRLDRDENDLVDRDEDFTPPPSPSHSVKLRFKHVGPAPIPDWSGEEI
jgi:hypothetical protein